MNKYQRALKVLSASEQQAWKEGYDVYDLQEAKDLLKELVQKATPKKLSHVFEVLYTCPSCGMGYIKYDKNYDYCPYCGQALKWDEEEEE